MGDFVRDRMYEAKKKLKIVLNFELGLLRGWFTSVTIGKSHILVFLIESDIFV